LRHQSKRREQQPREERAMRWGKWTRAFCGEKPADEHVGEHSTAIEAGKWWGKRWEGWRGAGKGWRVQHKSQGRKGESGMERRP
jgi:hypothetical protein